MNNEVEVAREARKENQKEVDRLLKAFKELSEEKEHLEARERILAVGLRQTGMGLESAKTAGAEELERPRSEALRWEFEELQKQATDMAVENNRVLKEMQKVHYEIDQVRRENERMQDEIERIKDVNADADKLHDDQRDKEDAIAKEIMEMKIS